MSRSIIHNNGAFNLYCSVTNSPVFVSAITENQLYDVLLQGAQNERLEFARAEQRERIERSKYKGTSSFLSRSLEEEIAANLAGPNESNLPFVDFVKQYLTLSN